MATLTRRSRFTLITVLAFLVGACQDEQRVATGNEGPTVADVTSNGPEKRVREQPTTIASNGGDQDPIATRFGSRTIRDRFPRNLKDFRRTEERRNRIRNFLQGPEPDPQVLKLPPRNELSRALPRRQLRTPRVFRELETGNPGGVDSKLRPSSPRLYDPRVDLEMVTDSDRQRLARLRDDDQAGLVMAVVGDSPIWSRVVNGHFLSPSDLAVRLALKECASPSRRESWSYQLTVAVNLAKSPTTMELAKRLVIWIGYRAGSRKAAEDTRREFLVQGGEINPEQWDRVIASFGTG